MSDAAPDQTDGAFDYGADAVPDHEAVAKAFSDLDRLTLMAERAIEARQRAEAALQKAKQAEERLITKDIPELLAKMHLSECTTSSGIEVKIKREIKVSLPGHERVEDRLGAFKWLTDNGHSGVIKNSVAVTLDRGEDTRADELVVDLRAKGYEVEQKKDVNYQTLCALARELFETGKLMPTDRFNIFNLEVAKLTRK